MNWMDRMGTGLGDFLIGANQPFGLAPPQMQDRQAAIQQGALSLGLNMLANPYDRPTEAMGKGYQMAQQQGMANQRHTLAMEQMMAQAEENRTKREEQRRQQEEFDRYISTLPPEQQALARMNPEAFTSNQIKSQFAPPEGPPELGLNLVPLQDENGNFAGWGQPSKSGGIFPSQIQGGDGLAPMSPYDRSFSQSAGTKAGAARGEAQGDLPGAMKQAEIAVMKIDRLLENPDIDKAVGWASYLPDAVTPNSIIDVRGRIRELQGEAFLQARQLLKGGGQITDFEGRKAEGAYARMETAIQSSDPTAFKDALRDFKEAVNDGVKKLAAAAGEPVLPSAPRRLKFNPETGELE